MLGQHRRVVRQVVELTEAVRGDDNVGLHRANDVVELLGPVEMHDGHDGCADIGGTPERDRSLHPVRQLEQHHVPRADPLGLQPPGKGSGLGVDISHRSAPGSGRRVHVEGLGPLGGQAVGDHHAQRGVGPMAIRDVSLNQFGGHGTKRPARGRIGRS